MVRAVSGDRYRPADYMSRGAARWPKGRGGRRYTSAFSVRLMKIDTPASISGRTFTRADPYIKVHRCAPASSSPGFTQ